MTSSEGQATRSEGLSNRSEGLSNRSGGQLTRALVMAAAHGHTEVCRVLLDHGAEVDEADESGHTALHLAAKHGHQFTCSLLVSRGAVNACIKAMSEGDFKTAEYLIIDCGISLDWIEEERRQLAVRVAVTHLKRLKSSKYRSKF